MHNGQYAIIRQAILQRRQMIFSYQGHERHVCPHVLGWKQGRKCVLAFQFGGTSSSGLSAGGDWRCMLVDGISAASMHDGPWHSQGWNRRTQKCVDEIDVEVDMQS